MILGDMKTLGTKSSDSQTPIGAKPVARESFDHSIPNGSGLAEPLGSKPAQPPVGNNITTPPEAPKQRWLLTLFALVALAGAGYYFFPTIKEWLGVRRPAAAPPPVRVIPVVTAPVGRADMKLYLNGLGTVTGYNTVTIRSRVEGELNKVAFTEGQLVKNGDLIAEIDPRPYQVQLDQAKARLAEAEAALQKAQHSQSREMAEAQVALDESQLRLASQEERRLRDLVANRTITANEWDIAVAARQKCEAQLQATKASLKQTAADFDINILSAQANASAATTAVRNAEIELSYCRIMSPITGRIGLRSVDQGNMIRPTDPNGLAVITQLQPITVVFTIPQDDIAAVQKKILDGEKLQVDAFDRGFETKLASGTLEAIDNQVDVATGTVRLKAVFANENSLLFPNQFVNARLLVDTLRQAITVPSAAVQRGPDMTYAYVVKPDSTVDLRAIVTGAADGNSISIESGLAPNDIVVIDGVDKLQKGSKIAARAQTPLRTASGAARQASDSVESAKKGS